jgi:hypothetical protein
MTMRQRCANRSLICYTNYGSGSELLIDHQNQRGRVPTARTSHNGDRSLGPHCNLHTAPH